jgi:nicotinamidase-related amidase
VVGRLIDVFGPRRLFLLSLDYQVTVLSDACADRNPALHDTLIAEVLARRGEVATVEEWAHTLKG